MPPEDTGYVFGVFDLLTLDHLERLDQASDRCARLVVGVATDALTVRCGGQPPIVPEAERLEIVAALRGVDAALLQNEDLPSAVRAAGARMVFAWADTDDVVQRALDPEAAFAGTDLQVHRLPAPTRRTAPAAGTNPDLPRVRSEVA
jgi:cytidyltransferase-like protein